jgi:YhcH/YjgK/YiaL family protein
MIIDTLDNLEKYESLNPLFHEVVEFLKKNDLKTLSPGKTEIVGDDLFVNITTAKGKSPEDAILETHKKMIDIQIPLSCAETYGYTPLCQLPEVDYDKEKDITKYEGPAQSYLTAEPGMFAIFFPQDGHAPCISVEDEIMKAIFKILA